MKSDADLIRDAKLEAMHLPTSEDQPRRQDKPQMATDEMVSRASFSKFKMPSQEFPGNGAIQETYAQVTAWMVGYIYVSRLLYHSSYLGK